MNILWDDIDMVDSKYNKSGKIFLIFTIGICIWTMYLAITLGFPSDNKLFWFTTTCLLFSSLSNIYINIKEKRIFYMAANVIVSITLISLVVGKLISEL